MGEPEGLHPFSSHFRSQLSDVLSRPAMVSQIKSIPDEKLFLETEIDSYSGVDFGKTSSTSCTKRPPTPPKPINRTFTFDTNNPFSSKPGEPNTLSLPKYAEVNKSKRRPKVPPKPKTRSSDTTKTLPLTQKLPGEHTKTSTEDYFFRVNSLPNLTPDKNHNKNIRASGNFLLPDSHSPSTPGYGQLNRAKQTSESNTSVYHMAQNDADYCDVIPESPTGVPNDTTTTINDSRYDNVYEDVNAKPTTVEELKLHPASGNHEGSDSDYTLMRSPVSEINFTFGRTSLYENCATIQSPNSDVFHSNEYENVGSPTLQRGDPNRVGLPEHLHQQSQILAIPDYHVSPTSSFDDQDSSAYSVQSSMASTTASSFQRVQVCFFPPSPPPDFYQNGVAGERPGSATSGSSTRSRYSRSRIPVPIKPKNPSKASTPDVPNHSLPPTPTPSPVVVRAENTSKSVRQIELSPPPIPPGDDMRVPANDRGVGSRGKGARWYEKLGCIQSDTLTPSEPYGRPGERKRSKSLSRDQIRKSQFFLPVEPNASNPPSAPHS